MSRRTPDTPIDDPQQWFTEIVETEIAPLLREYWFDDPEPGGRRISKAPERLVTLQSDTPVTGFVGRIPVRNIWLLLLYASQLYE